MTRGQKIPSDSVDVDGERETVPVGVQLFVARLDAVASLPWQVRGNWLHAHSMKQSVQMKNLQWKSN
jgi:hypothetical protein